MAQIEKVLMVANGPELSQFIQGYWRCDQWAMSVQERLTFLKQHMALGITTVDHAAIYGNPSCEQLFGEALSMAPELRQHIQIVTKCGIESALDHRVKHYDTSRARIIASVETSLLRLGTDYLDVLLLHRPDFLLDADEVCEAFTALMAAGKVRYFGVSNFSPAQFALLQSRLPFPLATNQVEINPINGRVMADGTLDQLQQLRIRPMAWSCLAGGRIFCDSEPAFMRLRKALDVIKHELDAPSIDAVLYAWVLRLPSRPLPLLGTGRLQRVVSALEGLKLKLSAEQWYRIWVAAQGQDVP